MASTPAVPVKDQYHHVIPRFILRRYKQVGSTIVSPPHREKPPARHSEFIYYYNISTRTLQLRSLATVYGATNLYYDASAPEDAMELEKKLSLLEGKAAQVITKIHHAVGKASTVSLTRREVEDLRKFLFVMYYRKENLARTYFQEDHPENAPARAWMQEYRTKYGLRSTADFWLHVLRYYLDTPHEQICKDYYEILKKHGADGVMKMMQGTIDPSVRFEAMAYGAQAGSFLTSIWEAADGEEFVLGHNSFGLWEGLCMGQPAIHRIFVVSPRIAIVHRNNMAIAGPNFPGTLGPLFLNSDLMSVPTPAANVEYLGLQGASPLEDVEWMMHYKASPAAQPDVFTFTITKLSASQTDAFNAVVLRNVKPDGSLTFLSAPCALRTLRRYCTSAEPENGLTKHLLSGLIDILSAASPTSGTTCPQPSRSGSAFHDGALSKEPQRRSSGRTPTTTSHSRNQSLPVDSLSSADALSATAHFTQDPATDCSADSQATVLEERLRNLIAAELEGTSTFPSRYSAARMLWRLCNHDDMPENPPRRDILRLTQEAFRRFSILLLPPTDRSFAAHPEFRVRKDLSTEESDKFFTLFDAVLDSLGVPEPAGKEGKPLLVLVRQAVMVGFAEKLAQTRHDALNGLLEPMGLEILE